jgi:argininosuccinate synthase
VIEDPWAPPPDDAYTLTASPSDAPAPEELVITFESGVPKALDGEPLSLADLVVALNARAGEHGIGRIDMVENRAIGIKSRELYEAPAAMTLIPAHQALEDLVLTRAEGTAKREIEALWAKTVYDGLWFSPLRSALDAFVDKTQELVSGDVRVRLQAGSAVVVGRRSDNALYAHALSSYGAEDAFPHESSEGFIRLAAMEVELAAARERKLALT